MDVSMAGQDADEVSKIIRQTEIVTGRGRDLGIGPALRSEQVLTNHLAMNGKLVARGHG
jgi:hypothetical protein